MKKSWYLEEYEEKDYLHNKKLQLKSVLLKKEEHYHCELCWNRLSSCVGDLQIGYYESLSKSWICETCYQEFKDLFGWSIQ
ncbi:MAG: hypothetical protein IJW48_00030 [Clostridia bacterium]|nr:hypothetical protein [Clostridia bacterium]